MEVLEETVTDTENSGEAVKQAEEAAVEQVEEVESETGEKNNVEKSKEGTPKGVQKRFDELTLKAKLAEEERERARIEAEFWKNQASGADKPQEQPREQPKALSNKPTLEEFQDYDAYVEALTDWKIEQKDVARQQQTAQAEYAQKMQKAVNSFEERVAKAVDIIPDFEEVARDPAMRRIFSAMPHVTDSILESEKGPEIAYYLGKNRQKAIELAQMNPMQAAMELGRIEAKLAPPPAKKVSQAPEPISTVAGGNNMTEKAPEEMTAKEFAVWRKSIIKNRR